MNGLLDCQQDNIETDDIELEDRNSKALHKVPDRLGSPRSDVKKTCDSLFSLD